MSIWDKFIKLEEQKENQSKIKTYKARKEFLIKEISFQDEEEKLSKYGDIEEIKNHIKIYDLIEDENCIYIVIDSDSKSSVKIDEI